MTDYFADAYGGKRGWLRHIGARAPDIVGRWRQYEPVDLLQVRRLVFVCRGNICRSPYAEARCRGLGASSASFGLGAPDGGEADPAARIAAANRGLDLSLHRTTSVASHDRLPGDLMVAMEPGQLTVLHTEHDFPLGDLTLLGLWSRPRRPYLHDPYGLESNYFETCYDIIDHGVATLVRRMQIPGAGDDRP